MLCLIRKSPVLLPQCSVNLSVILDTSYPEQVVEKQSTVTTMTAVSSYKFMLRSPFVGGSPPFAKLPDIYTHAYR